MICEKVLKEKPLWRKEALLKKTKTDCLYFYGYTLVR